MKIATTEIETIGAESKITRALQSKLLLATKYLILPANYVRVFIQRSGRWEGPFTAVRVIRKPMFNTDSIYFNPFKISAALAIDKGQTAEI